MGNPSATNSNSDLAKTFFALAIDVPSPIMCLRIRTFSFAVIEPEARLILTAGCRARPGSSKGLRHVRLAHAAAGGQTLVHDESLGLKIPDHYINAVTSFHPPALV